MAKIGKLIAKDREDELSELHGVIKTLDFEIEIRVKRRPPSENELAPTHSILAKSAAGGFEEVGAAWEKAALRGENIGEPFLSASMDDPSFPYALNFAIFRDRDSDGWVATWRRRQSAA